MKINTPFDFFHQQRETFFILILERFIFSYCIILWNVWSKRQSREVCATENLGHYTSCEYRSGRKGLLTFSSFKVNWTKYIVDVLRTTFERFFSNCTSFKESISLNIVFVSYTGVCLCYSMFSSLSLFLFSLLLKRTKQKTTPVRFRPVVFSNAKLLLDLKKVS